MITTKKQKEEARHDIDNLINNTTFPPNTERPGRSNRYNVNTALVSHAASLQKEYTPRTKACLQTKYKCILRCRK